MKTYEAKKSEFAIKMTELLALTKSELMKRMESDTTALESICLKAIFNAINSGNFDALERYSAAHPA